MRSVPFILRAMHWIAVTDLGNRCFTWRAVEVTQIWYLFFSTRPTSWFASRTIVVGLLFMMLAGTDFPNTTSLTLY
eukprot:8356347-Ditylum_brightwellii.AAC.1